MIEDMDWIDTVVICLQAMEFGLYLYAEKCKIKENVVEMVIYTQNPRAKVSF